MSRKVEIGTSWCLRAGLSLLVFAMSTPAMSGESPRPQEVRLVVTASGQYLLDGRPVDLADLRARLRELKSGGQPIDLHVVAGARPEYRFVAPALQIVQEEGLGKVGLLTTAPVASGPSTSP